MPLLILTRTSIIVAAQVGIAVALTTLVIAAPRLTSLRCKSFGINGFAILGSDRTDRSVDYPK
jgi:hypothetical protein